MGRDRGRYLPPGGGGADGLAAVIVELTAGLATLLTIPAKIGMLANELTMLSKLAVAVLAAGTGEVEEAEFNVAAAGLATVSAAPAKLGIWAEMLLAMLLMEGGAERGGEGVGPLMGAGPLMEAATSARDGMLIAMMSVTPARDGKTPPRGGRGRASSPKEEDTVTSSDSDIITQ